jgi:hypothetical protein
VDLVTGHGDTLDASYSGDNDSIGGVFSMNPSYVANLSTCYHPPCNTRFRNGDTIGSRGWQKSETLVEIGDTG